MGLSDKKKVYTSVGFMFNFMPVNIIYIQAQKKNYQPSLT